MLVWINGPFGGGKTVTAYELARRVAGSVVCDPEHVGFGLHRTLPRALRKDFQDLRAWREGVFEVLDLAAGGHPGPVIVPMTVVEPAYFRQTVGRLREQGHEVRHFTLLAARETVVGRLRTRGVGRVLRAARGKDAPLRRESFAMGKLDLCLERLSGPEFAEHLWTDRIGVPEVAARIAHSAGLDIAPDTDGPLRGQLRRALVSARHIRLG
jgi:hypothetical protein